jgi:protein-tyrosine phosphatase
MIEVASSEAFVQGSPELEPVEPVDLFFIECRGPGRLATMKRPRAGQALPGQIAQLGAKGVHVLVSLLTPREVDKLGLEAERDLAADAGLEFLTFPIEDHGLPPSPVAVTRFTGALATRMSAGKTVAIHCRAGIGRSSLIAAVVMMRLDTGVSADLALTRISKARGMDVPDTDAQRAWLREFRPKL